jgi:hypothetical protein
VLISKFNLSHGPNLRKNLTDRKKKKAPLKPKRPPGRPPVAKHLSHVRLLMETEDYELVKSIAQVESVAKDKTITANALIREAIRYVYQDCMRLRELFKRFRSRGVGKVRNKSCRYE